MASKKFGIEYDLFPRSDLEFMREPALDPGDGRGSYSQRDKMLMVEFKAATAENVNGEKERREQRKALIWLLKYLARESKARMTVRKAEQTIHIREKPDFLSPLPALEILRIGSLKRLSEGEWCKVRDRIAAHTGRAIAPVDSEGSFFANIEPYFLDAALSREQCPKHALDLIEDWQDRCWVQSGRAKQELPEHLRERTVARRTREDCWFKPGECPNPNGRPKGSKNKSNTLRDVRFFDEMVTVKIGGKKRRLRRRDAILQKAQEFAVARRDHQIIRLLLDHDLPMAKLQVTLSYNKYTMIHWSHGGIHPHSLEGAIHALGGGDLLYANSSTARMLLEPWVIELGLAHLGNRKLTRMEQRIVLYFARHPKRTAWPEWWEADLREREK